MMIRGVNAAGHGPLGLSDRRCGVDRGFMVARKSVVVPAIDNNPGDLVYRQPHGCQQCFGAKRHHRSPIPQRHLVLASVYRDDPRRQ